jgi:hypothetical protein
MDVTVVREQLEKGVFHLSDVYPFIEILHVHCYRRFSEFLSLDLLYLLLEGWVANSPYWRHHHWPSTQHPRKLHQRLLGVRGRVNLQWEIVLFRRAHDTVLLGRLFLLITITPRHILLLLSHFINIITNITIILSYHRCLLESIRSIWPSEWLF